MKITKIHLAYFSATYTTRTVVRHIAQQIGDQIIEYDLTDQMPCQPIMLNKADELLIVGVPVYAGRVPSVARKALNKLQGAGTLAIAVCVYGNRHYDDAILELKELIETNGFKTIAAAAFIAQHSIFPKVATNRPDQSDIQNIERFAHHCAESIQALEETKSLPNLQIKGNKPYKIPGEIPLHPVGCKKTCNQCGICVKLCPMQAISPQTPYLTDSQKCITCGRCIVVCPRKSRRFKGLLYKIAGWKFTKNNAGRKEPEWFTI